LKESRDNMDRRKQYTDDSYKKGYEPIMKLMSPAETRSSHMRIEAVRGSAHRAAPSVRADHGIGVPPLAPSLRRCRENSISTRCHVARRSRSATRRNLSTRVRQRSREFYEGSVAVSVDGASRRPRRGVRRFLCLGFGWCVGDHRRVDVCSGTG
jgi:hypothetical protein